MTKRIQNITLIVGILFMASLAPLQAAAEKPAKAPKAWFEAAGYGNKARLEKLRPQVNVNAKNYSGWTALHLSADKGHLAVVKWLVAQGADMEAQDKNGRTALHKSAYRGHLAVVKWLVAQRADLHAKTKDGQTALLVSAWKGHLAVVKWLVAQGADLHATNQYGETALDLAGQGGVSSGGTIFRG